MVLRSLILLMASASSLGAPVAITQTPVDEPPDAVAPVEIAEPEPEVSWTEWEGHWYRVVDDLLYDERGIAWRVITVTTTAYAPTLDQCDADPDVTATGSDAYATYGLAADPRALPYGSVVRVPGYGDARVDDTGRAMRRSWRRGTIHLDLRIPKRRFDGTWRSDAECSAIARRHGIQRERVVLVQVPILQPQ